MKELDLDFLAPEAELLEEALHQKLIIKSDLEFRSIADEKIWDRIGSVSPDFEVFVGEKSPQVVEYVPLDKKLRSNQKIVRGEVIWNMKIGGFFF